MLLPSGVAPIRSRVRRVDIPRRGVTRLAIELLEDRTTPAAPATPVISEPLNENQLTGYFDVNMHADESSFTDADNDTHASTEWVIRQKSDNVVVWQTNFLTSVLSKYRVDFADGSHLNVEGEHDMAYLTPGKGLAQPGFAPETLAALAHEMYGDDDTVGGED